MTPVSNFHLADKARRSHRRNKSLPALIAGAAKVVSNGSLRVELTTVTREVFVYALAPRTEWVAKLVERRPAPIGRPPRPIVSPEAQLRSAVELTLNALARVDRAAQSKASPEIAAE